MGSSAMSSQIAAAAASAVAQMSIVGSVMGEGGALTKPHRELYVGNLPAGVTIPQLAEFLNGVMKQLGLSQGAMSSVVTAWVSSDGHYAFVEFRTIEETQAALTYLNGMQIGASSLKVGRPKGYNGTASSVAVPMGTVSGVGLLGGLTMSSAPGISMLGGGMGIGMGMGMVGALNGGGLGPLNPLMSAIGLGMGLGIGGLEPTATEAAATETSNVIMVTNLPMGISDEQARELVSTFGELKGFNMIMTSTSCSAVLEYLDPSITTEAIGNLGKLDIAGLKLSVHRVPASSAAMLLQPTSAPLPPTPLVLAVPPSAAVDPGAAADPLSSYPPTSVLRLSNMTTEEDLTDDELYEELREDVMDECSRHGKVVSIVIPRQERFGGRAVDAGAVGQIFIQFADTQGAVAARKSVGGRSFNGNIVRALFFPEELFVTKRYVVPRDFLAEADDMGAMD